MSGTCYSHLALPVRWAKMWRRMARPAWRQEVLVCTGVHVADVGVMDGKRRARGTANALHFSQAECEFVPVFRLLTCFRPAGNVGWSPFTYSCRTKVCTQWCGVWV